MTQKKNIAKQQRIGNALWWVESSLSLYLFSWILIDRFANIFFLPFSLTSDKLYLAYMVPTLFYSIIELVICGFGVSHIVKGYANGSLRKKLLWKNRVLMLSLLLLYLFYFALPFTSFLYSFDEEITSRFIGFVSNLCDGG